MEGFAEGYEFFANHASGFVSGELGNIYIESISEAIKELTDNLNGFKGYKTLSDQLKGDVAEYWHAGTFNIDAAVNDSSSRATVPPPGLKGFASVDAETSWGERYGLKYYKNGVESAKQQAKSLYETFIKYQHEGGKDSFEKYCADRGYSVDHRDVPIYLGQVRLIPADQLKDAIAWLEKKIRDNEYTRPEQLKRYEDTLALLRDRIKDNKGNESIPLSKEDAKKLADLAKDGDFEPADFGLTTEELIKFRNVMQQAFKAGLTSAVITMVMKTAPEILRAIQYLIESGEIDIEQYEKIGISAATGAAEGFLYGALSAAIVTNCRSGALGSALKSVDPSVIGMVTVVAIDAIKNSYKVAKGEITRYAMTNDLVRDLFVGTCGVVLGAVAQYFISLPVLGYMLGSFVGSTIGSFVYQIGYSATISFCIDTGFTAFGLVDQNYKLPDDVMQDIGIEVFEYENFDYERFEYDKFEFDRFEPDRFEVDTVDITFLRRGVIGVSQIGYI